MVSICFPLFLLNLIEQVILYHFLIVVYVIAAKKYDQLLHNICHSPAFDYYPLKSGFMGTASRPMIEGH